MAFEVPEEFRVTQGKFGTSASDGNNGAFFIPRDGETTPLRVVASDHLGWEHVSVSLPGRTPTWGEMSWVKDLFWGPEDVVIQYHPAEGEYVNAHPNCLHMWRPVGEELPTPPMVLV